MRAIEIDVIEIQVDVEVNRAIEQGRLAFGESANDILRRLLLPARRGRARVRPAADATDGAAADTTAGGAPAAGPSRSRGLWSVEIAGKRIAAANLKHAYRLLLRELDAAHPHFLAAFADEKTFGRRYVARTPAALFARSPHLARRHAAPIGDGWYFDTNVSVAQVARRARIAARLCGLPYGSEVRILDNLREI